MNKEKINIVETQEELPVNTYYVKLLTREIFFFKRTLHDKKELNPDQEYTFKANLKILSALVKKYRAMLRQECVRVN